MWICADQFSSMEMAATMERLLAFAKQLPSRPGDKKQLMYKDVTV